VSHGFLRNYLRVGNIPADVAPWVTATYGARFTPELSYNTSLGEVAGELLRHGVDTDVQYSLAIRGSTSVLEKVLSDPKWRSASILLAIINTWDLKPADQLRLVARKLPPVIADDILNRNWCAKAKAEALQYASAVGYLTHKAQVCTLDNAGKEELLRDLAVRAEDVHSLWDLVAVLLIRPDVLEDIFAGTSSWLKMAACWCELDEKIQKKAAKFACSQELFSKPTDPVAGMLTQTNLSRNLRALLEAHRNTISQKTWHRSRDLRYPNVGWRYGDNPIKVRDMPLASAESVLRAVESIQLGERPLPKGQFDIVSLRLLLDMSHNPLLAKNSRAAMKLRGHFINAANTYHGNPYGSPGPLAQALHRVLALETGKNNRTKVRQLMEMMGKVPHSPNLDVLLRSSDKVPTKTAVRSKWSMYESKCGETVEFLLGQPVSRLAEESSTMQGRIRALSTWFATYLGDGRDEKSKAAWRLFFGLVEDDPDTPITRVLDTARLLGASSVADQN
jgi:hypothetical protein